jgi:hypothetical protein
MVDNSSVTDKISNIVLKSTLRNPSTNTNITNLDYETTLTTYNDIISADDLHIETIPSLSSVTFDSYFLYDSNLQEVLGYNSGDNSLTGDSFSVIKGFANADTLSATFPTFDTAIWQEFINGNINKINVSSTSPIIQIENLKTSIVKDTYNNVTPSFYSLSLKDAVLDTYQNKGYSLSLYGYSSNIQIDISNKDVGDWTLNPMTGIIQFLDSSASIVVGGTNYSLFSSNLSLTDTSLFNKVKSPYITFYRYRGAKGLSTYSTLTAKNIVEYGSNISFISSTNTIDSTIQGTYDGGLVISLNPTSVTALTIGGNLKADKVTSARFTLNPLAGTSVTGSFLTAGNDLFFTAGNVGIGTADPTYTLDIWGSAYISGPSKISIQGGIDGGTEQGIFMKTATDSTWGIYMATSGSLKSLSGGTAVYGNESLINDAMRFRANDNTLEGFIWENSSESCLMSLKGDSGDLYVKGRSTLSTVLLNGAQQAGGSWLSIGNNNYGAYYGDSITGRFGLVSTSALNSITNLQWGVQINRDGATSLSYGGSEKLLTTSSGTTFKDYAKVGDHLNLITPNVDTAFTVHKYNATNDNTYIQFYSDALTTYNSTNGLLFGLTLSNVELTNYEKGYIKFKTNGIDAIYINSNGVVGINTTNPKSSNNLDIAGNVIATSYTSSNSYVTGGFWVPIDMNNYNYASFVSSSNDTEFGILSSSKLNAYSNQKWYLTGDVSSGNVSLYYSNVPTLQTVSNGVQIYNNLSTSNIYTTGRIGIGNTNPYVSIDISSTDAIVLPAGTTSQRPTSVKNGMIRYNTDLNNFEGYSFGSWTSIGGSLVDLDGNTYIIPENAPGTNNNQLKMVTNGAFAMIVDSNQRIGIGTTSPVVSLDINSNDAIKIPSGTTIQRPSTGKTGMVRYNTDTLQYEGYANNNWVGLGGVIDVNQDTKIIAETTSGANNDQLQFFTSNIQAMIIDKNQKIGIGTTSPLVSFDINSNDAIKIPVGTSVQRPLVGQVGMVRYNTQTSQYEGYANNNWIGLGGVIDVNQDTRIIAETSPGANNDQLVFYTSNIQAMIIDKNQFVGISNNNPKYSLDINGITNINSNLYIQNGRLGIGTSNPQYILDVYGTAKFNSNLIVSSSNTTLGGTLNISGVSALSNQLYVTGTSTFSSNLVVSTNNTTLGGSLNVLGAASFSNGVILGSTTTHNSNLIVGNYNTTLGGSLNVSGVSALSNQLYVTGTSTFNSNLIVSTNNTTLGGSLNVLGAASFSNGVILGATTTHNSNLIVGNYNTTLGGSLNVSGAASFSNDVILGATTTHNSNLIVGNYNTALGGSLNVSGVSALSNQLYVTGTSTFNSNLIVDHENTTLGGTLNVSGVSALSNQLYVKGTSTFSSNLVVLTNNTTLGGTLNVSGVASFTQQIGIGITNPSYPLHIINASDPTMLIGTSGGSWGKLYLGNAGTGIAKGYSQTNFLDGNDVLVFTAGSGSAGFKTAGGFIKLLANGKVGIGSDTPLHNLDVIGNVNITTNLTIGNNSLGLNSTGERLILFDTGTQSTNLSIGVQNGSMWYNVGNNTDSHIFYTNNTKRIAINSSGLSIDNNLIVSGNTNITGGVALSNSLTVSGNTNITGGVALSNSLTVSGSTILGSNLIVGNYNTTLGGSLNVSGVASFSNGVILGGITTYSNNLVVGNYNTTLGGSLNVTGVSALSNQLYVTGTSTFSSNLVVSTNNTTLGGSLNVSGVTALSNQLYIKGTSTFSSNLIVSSSNTTLGGTVNISGVTSLSNQLNVSGNTILNSDLYISSGLVGIGTLTPQVSVHINKTDSLRIPVGTSLQRPLLSNTGDLRYNTTTLQYEGYANNNWTGLGGVIDVNQDTKITAETAPGTNNDQLKFYTSNYQAMMIDSNQHVGIGTTSPQYSLDVYGDTRTTNCITGRLFIGDSNLFNNFTDNRDNLGSIYYTYGNIGFGTTNPQYTLDVYGTINANSNLYIASNGRLGVGNSNPQFTLDVTGNVGFSNTLQVVGIVSLSNNLIMGNTTKHYQIDFGSSSIQASPATNMTGTKLYFYYGSGTNITSYAIGIEPLALWYNSGTGSHKFYTNGTNVFNIDSTGDINLINGSLNMNPSGISPTTTGNFGINWWNTGGNTAHATYMSVNSTVSFGGGTLCTYNSSTASIRNRLPNGNTYSFIWENSADTLLMGLSALTGGLYVKNNVGIGVTNSSYNLQVNGTTYISGDTTLGGTLNVTGTGTFNSNLVVNSDVDLFSSLQVLGITSLSNQLNVKGTSTFSSNLVVSLSNTTLGGTLNVSGIASFSNNVNISGYAYRLVPVMARRNSAAQPITTAIATAVLYDTAETDMDYYSSLTGLTYSTGKFQNTSGVTRVYSVCYQIGFAPATTVTGLRLGFITVTSTGIDDAAKRFAASLVTPLVSAALGTVLTGSAIVKLNANDYLCVFAYHTQGATLNIGGTDSGFTTGYYTRVQIALL